MTDISGDELPDLLTLLAPRKTSTAALRQSPRKAKTSGPAPIDNDVISNVSIVARQTRASPRKRANSKASPVKAISISKAPSVSLLDVPVLPRNDPRTEVSVSSRNGLANSPQQRSIGLTHVDSLLLPLSKVCLDANAAPKRPNFSTRGIAASASTKGSKAASISRNPTKASKFVLSEAACADDSENSLVDEEEDEDTDLSGFIVDDDAELSVHESSSDFEVDKRTKRKPSISPRKRKLQRGSRRQRPAETLWLDSDSDKENKLGDSLNGAFQGLKLGSKKETGRRKEIEIVDLTSPDRTHRDVNGHMSNTGGILSQSTASRKPGESINIFDDFDAILKFSPPCSSHPAILPKKAESCHVMSEGASSKDPASTSMHVEDGFKTPPGTPPRSPSKLKSPSKLLSPSKRAAQVPKSPHRQSLEGFWDLEAVNAWNDEYSPKKVPLPSPKKNRFLEWLDSADEDDETPPGLLNDSSGLLLSPCSSPRKARSPQRSPEKAEKQRLLEEKRAAKTRKQDFESKKEQLATTLMTLLDMHITSSQLSTLSASTGGVQIIWSKTLRSTAGRANWRRTVTKPSGSPVKGSLVPEGSKVQHYASIDLAAKVIDSEPRLVNTLAHEFCHLAKFMVSGVRDQPHGSSFKAWAGKVTKFLRGHENPMYRGVEVTTKHSYTIDHKYLWVCAGREALIPVAKDVPEMGDGCGAEYGRHSKSIDTEKHRCGRCKGVLVQVRPKPRKVETKRESPRKALFQKREKSDVESVAEEVELVDLSD
jgi:predicted SprT family Zn-dependent metalloprotease